MATTPPSSFLTLTTSSLTFIITKAHIKESLESLWSIECEGYIKAMEDIVVKVAENSLSKEDLKNNLEKIFAKSVKETTKIIHKAKK